MKRTEPADNTAIDADAGVHDEEEHKVLVVMESYAVVDPDAMVVKLLATHVAEVAVLTAGRLGRFTCITPALVEETDIIIVVPFYSAFNNCLIGAFLDKSWVGVTSQVVAVVACRHEGPSNVLVVVVNVGVGNVFKAVCYVHVVATNSEKEVHALNCGVCLIAHVGLSAFHKPYDALTARQLA